MRFNLNNALNGMSDGYPVLLPIPTLPGGLKLRTGIWNGWTYYGVPLPELQAVTKLTLFASGTSIDSPNAWLVDSQGLVWKKDPGAGISPGGVGLLLIAGWIYRGKVWDELAKKFPGCSPTKPGFPYSQMALPLSFVKKDCLGRFVYNDCLNYYKDSNGKLWVSQPYEVKPDFSPAEEPHFCPVPDETNTPCPCDCQDVEVVEEWWLTDDCKGEDCIPIEFYESEKKCTAQTSATGKQIPCDEVKNAIRKMGYATLSGFKDNFISLRGLSSAGNEGTDNPEAPVDTTTNNKFKVNMAGFGGTAGIIMMVILAGTGIGYLMTRK